MTSTRICSACQQAFERKGSADKFAERVSVLLVCEHNCACPTVSVSPHSPKPVQQSEHIAACASHPHHTAQNGSVTHKVFDRAFTQGLSVTRLEFARAGISGVLSFCNLVDVRKQAKQPALLSVGAVTMCTQDVRSILFRKCNTPAFKVYDTAGASEAMVAHADIVGSKYFGALEELPKPDQPVRNWAQRQLSMKMKFVPQEPA